MNHFIRSLCWFSIVLLAVSSSIIGGAAWYMNNVKFAIDKSKNILVIGDSHTECAIDDSVFRRAANFSKSATSFVYSYAALRKLLADNPQIDTVVLSYHSSSLLYERERGWIFDESIMIRQVPVFLPYFTSSEFMLFIFRSNFYKPALATPLSAWDYYQSTSNGKRSEWIDQNIGNYREFTWSNFSRDTAATKPLDSVDRRDTVSKVTIRYIRKIADLCRRNGITLVLMNAPVYQWDRYVNNAEFVENRKKYFDDLLFLDYSHFPVADSGRFDIWHLNATGARQFSAYLEANMAKDICNGNRRREQ